jgi:cellulose biosynthesis protein BcsQ
MTKQLNLVLNGKGGVGKSFFAVNAVQELKDKRRNFRAADTDDENSTLLRFHADTDFVNIQKPREIDRLFALLESTDLLIVDCRAASTDLFLDYFAEINLREVLSSLDARLTLITPVNHEADSVEQLRLLSTRLNDLCRYVVVKNQAHSEQFRIYEESKTRARIVGELQGREITMSRLHDWLVTALNENNVTAGAALTHPAFSLIDRQRLKHWQRLFHEQLALLDDLLLPQPKESKT